MMCDGGSLGTGPLESAKTRIQTSTTFKAGYTGEGQLSVIAALGQLFCFVWGAARYTKELGKRQWTTRWGGCDKFVRTQKL